MPRSLVPRAACMAALLPLFLSLPCHPQQAATQSSEPSDPKALMFAARALNNLAAKDVKPWHIQATFQLFDDHGAVTDEGTYEEFWASTLQFKRIFTGKSFSQTEYGSKKGVLLANTKGEIPDLLLAARNNLVSPLPFSDVTIEHTTYTTKPLNSGSIKFLCAVPTASAPGAPPDTSAYCFDTDQPILRIAMHPSTSDQSFHNRLVRVDGRTIATDLKILHNGKPTIALHVQEAAVLDPSEEAVFTPPPDAVPGPIRIEEGVSAGMLVYKVTPDYPPIAKATRVSGIVVIQAIIGKDGHTRALKVLSGPPMLQQSALDAVRQWRYHPYLLYGEPVEVMTSINVIFSLGG